MCERSSEDIDHHIIHCLVASRFWWQTLNWFEVLLMMPGTVKHVLLSIGVLVEREEDTTRGIWHRYHIWGIEINFVQLSSILLSLIFFWCIHDISFCIEDRVLFVENYYSLFPIYVEHFPFLFIQKRMAPSYNLKQLNFKISLLLLMKWCSFW